MHIEALLIDELGDVGRKLHTGRSRNDQVSTDFRLWVRTALDNVDQLLLNLQQSFVNRCHDDHDVILPGYTHLQRAQPVLASHYWLAYCEKLQRDRQRIADCRKRVNVSSLGVAAVAGTSIPIIATQQRSFWASMVLRQTAWMSRVTEILCWSQLLCFPPSQFT